MRDNGSQQYDADSCRPLVSERNRYFTGKYMTARDFRADQEYFLSHHRLHNRLLHGWGVACGFAVTRHRDPKCRDWLVVGPGIALDCCGRELVLSEETAFHVTPEDVSAAVAALPAGGGTASAGEGTAPAGEGTAPAGGSTDAAGPADAARATGEAGPEASASGSYPRPDREYLLCAVHCEEEVERVPVVFEDCGCDPDRREPNRTREGVTLELRPRGDFDPSCWGSPRGGDPRCRDDCDDDVPAAGGSCVEPEVVCDGRVPIALVTLRRDGSVDFETRGRRRLPPAPEYLTHVSGSSWEHGGTMSVGELTERGRLEISFDRRLAPTEGIATGINSETLLVQHAGEGDDLEFVPYDADNPPALVDDSRAVYTIDPGFLSGRRRGGLIGSTVYVTLLADFVLDCHDLAVDGDHVGGRLPSGNGTPGGTFRSWFRIGDGQEYGS